MESARAVKIARTRSPTSSTIASKSSCFGERLADLVDRPPVPRCVRASPRSRGATQRGTDVLADEGQQVRGQARHTGARPCTSGRRSRRGSARRRSAGHRSSHPVPGSVPTARPRPPAPSSRNVPMSNAEWLPGAEDVRGRTPAEPGRPERMPCLRVEDFGIDRVDVVRVLISASRPASYSAI